MTYLVDTNVISELARREPNPGVLAWAETVERMALSVITAEEIAYGLAWHPSVRLTAWWRRTLSARVEVLAVTQEVATRAGALRGKLAASGQPREQADMIIAATAAARRLTVVTRNTRDFDGCGVPVLNPFAE